MAVSAMGRPRMRRRAMVEILLWSWDWNLKGLRLISNLTRDRVNRDSSRLFTNILKRKIDDMCKVETTSMANQVG